MSTQTTTVRPTIRTGRKTATDARSLAHVLEAVEQCDGSWRVPMWTPDRGWSLVDFDTDDSPRLPLRRRADCHDPLCTALHQEEQDEWKRARTHAERMRVIRRQLREQEARTRAAADHCLLPEEHLGHSGRA